MRRPDLIMIVALLVMSSALALLLAAGEFARLTAGAARPGAVVAGEAIAAASGPLLKTPARIDLAPGGCD